MRRDKKDAALPPAVTNWGDPKYGDHVKALKTAAKSTVNHAEPDAAEEARLKAEEHLLKTLANIGHKHRRAG